jgi:protein tyrosine phosphatase
VGRDAPARASLHEANKLKNRYGNITAYDHSRVRMPVINNDPFSDYINVNYIAAYKRPQGYIVTQGPVPNSFISFWRMVWLTKAEVIVMVTLELEGGKMKCHRYWPDPSSLPPSTSQSYGDVKVTFINLEQHKNFISRFFEIECNGEKRLIRQFTYTSWPDHGVPLTTSEMLGFRNVVTSCVTNKDAPIIIHCSAGVGRTGTFIAIDRLVDQCLDMGGDLDVDAIIKDMRLGRNYMVQTEMQYIFIYRAVLDAITELLHGESKKSTSDPKLSEVAEAAVKARTLDQKREREVIEETKREFLSGGTSGKTEVITTSIKDRKKLLEAAPKMWVENYRKSLEEWTERNQFEADVYDLTSTLTPVQSRVEALKQSGLLV